MDITNLLHNEKNRFINETGCNPEKVSMSKVTCDIIIEENNYLNNKNFVDLNIVDNMIVIINNDLRRNEFNFVSKKLTEKRMEQTINHFKNKFRKRKGGNFWDLLKRAGGIDEE